MVLPIYNTNITSEEALSQFEFAASRLVLFPRGKRNIRDHVFDAATDALIIIRGLMFYTSDQPLRLDAKAIKVELTID